MLVDHDVGFGVFHTRDLLDLAQDEIAEGALILDADYGDDIRYAPANVGGLDATESR